MVQNPIMVFRRQMQKYLHPVNTIKHIIDNQGGLIAGTQAFVTIAKGVDAPVLGANPDHCLVGSHVRSIFLNIQVAASSTGALANVYMIIYGNPAGNIPVADIPDGNVTGTSDFKKQIFHTEMIMTEKNTTAIPRTLFKGVLKIPRKFQRMGQADNIQISLFSPGVTWDYCVESIYKEIR